MKLPKNREKRDRFVSSFVDWCMIIAVFRASGKDSLLITSLKMFVRVGAITSDNNCRSFTVMPSSPGAAFFFIVKRVFTSSVSLMGLRERVLEFLLLHTLGLEEIDVSAKLLKNEFTSLAITLASDVTSPFASFNFSI